MARSFVPHLAARFFAPATGALLAILAASSVGGCLVSFDGYELGSGGSFAGDAAESRSGAASLGSAGKPASNGGESAAEAGAAGDSASGSGPAGNGSGGMSSAGASSSRAGSHSGGATAGGAGTAGSSGGTSGVAGASGSAGSPSAGASGTGGSGALVCPEKHQRISVQIPLPNGSFYCIDRAEVKNSEYKAFLDEQVGTSGQAAVCAFNTSFEPDTTNGCNQYDPVGKKNQPIACVDWCDAAAFCKWDGKHLCGNLAGGSNAPASFADPNQSAWYRACSHAGDFDLPYGNVYDGMKCIGLENTAIHPVAVPYTDCEGGYSGLYDMSGNVAEWEDSCSGSDGAVDKCVYRGGSYLDTNKPVAGQPSLLCNSSVHGAPQMATKARSTRDKEIGFRCCSEPIPAP